MTALTQDGDYDAAVTTLAVFSECKWVITLKILTTRLHHGAVSVPLLGSFSVCVKYMWKCVWVEGSSQLCTPVQYDCGPVGVRPGPAVLLHAPVSLIELQRGGAVFYMGWGKEQHPKTQIKRSERSEWIIHRLKRSDHGWPRYPCGSLFGWIQAHGSLDLHIRHDFVHSLKWHKLIWIHFAPFCDLLQHPRNHQALISSQCTAGHLRH